MKKQFFIVKSNTWLPSGFYDSETKLIWVMDFKLFRKIKSGNIKPSLQHKYAIHKDVYDAFMYKLRNMKKTRKKVPSSN
jgi:hypothetical protein